MTTEQTPVGIEMAYCHYCKCVTHQVSETTGMRCQKCLNQNPFYDETKEFESYMLDLIRMNGLKSMDDIYNHFANKKKNIREFIESKTGEQKPLVESSLPDYFKHLPTGKVYACVGGDGGYYWAENPEDQFECLKFDQGDCEPIYEDGGIATFEGRCINDGCVWNVSKECKCREVDGKFCKSYKI